MFPTIPRYLRDLLMFFAGAGVASIVGLCIAAEEISSQFALDVVSLVVELVSDLAWPIVAFSLVFLFRHQLTNLLNQLTDLLKSLKRFRYKDWEFEMEEGEDGTEQQVGLLKSIVAGSAHSYRHIRDNTPLKLSDEEFDSLIKKKPGVFQPTRIVHRDENGNRIMPGLPGVKLKK